MPAPDLETLPVVIFFLEGQVATPEESAAVAALPARVLVRWGVSSVFGHSIFTEECDGVAALADESIPPAYRDFPRVELTPAEAA